MNKNCSVCGGSEFIQHTVLWSELCETWKLSQHEIEYVNKQQGHCCINCGSNMRTRVLASAIISSYFDHDLLKDLISDNEFGKKKILEINQAGSLHQFISTHSQHRLIEYPEFDMMNLDLPSEEFDLIIHSDTLEHVADPVAGMRECCRVLKKGGKCFYTIPIILDRMTKSRLGLAPSYHGNPEEKPEDYLVYTEFGCDAWRTAFAAGFKTVKIHALDFPSAFAFELEK
jgi:SAM-dependent methyltransferase